MLNNSRLRGLPSSSSTNYVEHLLSQLQSDLVFATRLSALDEVGAAMAHQLNDPLTALLLYLHEIKEKGERSNGPEAFPNQVREMVDMALRETERVCDIVQRVGRANEAAADTKAAAGFDSSASVAKVPGGAMGRVRPVRACLTPREQEVLALITDGDSNKQGGYRLGISTRTFEVHRAHIMTKLGARNAADLVRMVLTESHDG